MTPKPKRASAHSQPPQASDASAMTEQQIDRAAAVLGNMQEASRYLSEQERESLDRAQQSVVEARRQADLQAGHLRVR